MLGNEFGMPPSRRQTPGRRRSGLSSVAVGAGACVFGVCAGRAVAEVEGELLDSCLGIGHGLDLDNDRKIVSFREGFVGDQRVAFFGEAHAGRIRATAAGDGNALSSERDGVARIIDRRDFYLAVFGDEELKVGFDAGENAPAVQADDLLCLVVGMFFGVSVVAFGLGKGEPGECEGECRRKGSEFLVLFCFHGLLVVVWFWVRDQSEALVLRRIDFSDALRPKR